MLDSLPEGSRCVEKSLKEMKNNKVLITCIQNWKKSVTMNSRVSFRGGHLPPLNSMCHPRTLLPCKCNHSNHYIIMFSPPKSLLCPPLWQFLNETLTRYVWEQNKNGGGRQEGQSKKLSSHTPFLLLYEIICSSWSCNCTRYCMCFMRWCTV